MGDEIKFTASQQAAIDCDAVNILVNAAAGSGKTAVLTARIMRHIRQGIGLDRLLVVTFTEAAAASMKDKITEKLHEAMAESGMGFLARQAASLPHADISTIHAFCRKLVKEHFQQVGLDPAFRVGDDAELSLIKASVMQELFEEEYREAALGDPRGFLDLADVYGGKAKDERLEVLVQKVYDFLESDPFPAAAAERYAAMYGTGSQSDCAVYGDTDALGVWITIAREELAQGLAAAAENTARARMLCTLPGGPDKYTERLERDAETVLRLQDSLGGTFEEMYDAFRSIDWGRLPSIGKKDEVDAELKERVQRVRNKGVKKAVDDLAKGVFFAPPQKMRGDIASLAPRVRALMGLATRFAHAYAAEKRTRNLLDFSDLEHFAIRVLYPNGPEDMTPGLTSDLLGQKFHEVLIDEYQDANEVQELILSAVCKRRFMVGDMKQGIYRFRRANPILFKRKYDTYSHHWNPSAPPSLGVRIDLSQNFRSRAEVIDGVNFFFSQLMCRDVGEIDYDDAATLKTGASYPPWPENQRFNMMVDLLDEGGGEEETDEDDEADVKNTSPLKNEARMIAERVRGLLKTQQVWDAELGAYRLCRLSDMVILTRSLTGIAPDIIEELKDCGIPAVADMGAAFFEQIEVKTALSFLRVTDNPRQDIDLVTVLGTPTYGVDEDELLQIRLHGGDGDFYDCVLAYIGSAEGTPGEDRTLHDKLNRFHDDLLRFRAAATCLPISRLIGLIYDTTRYPAYMAAMPGGAARLANLRLLLERAISFEETRLTGLFHFTRYIQRLYDSNAADRVGAAAAEASNTDSLRLMTIHKSKGLEFPIVFVSFLGRKFNTEDERQPVILHSESGIGAYYTDTALRTQSNTLPRFSLQRLTRRENLSEELRCLYVAMTRAMQCLILTGRCADYTRDREKWLDAAEAPTPLLPVYYRRSASRYLDWIMPCLLRNTDSPVFTLHVHKTADFPALYSEFRIPNPEFTSPGSESQTLDPESPPPHSESQIPNPEFPTFYSDFRLPTSEFPSKLSISELKRLYASDLTPDSTPQADPFPPIFDPPQFIKASQGMTPMRMGSILHAITEHMDYHTHTTPERIEALITRLIDKNLLTPDEAAVIDRKKIETLTASPLADRIRAAKQLHREVPFVMKLETGTLVHGIIDAFFEEGGQIVLIDFKSDHTHDTSETDLIARHSVQLDIYKKALTAATAKAVKEVLLYSFALGRAITVI
ncbi:MAG: helicase-exonuclease AddAB subunit AddA [Defluviitaleaceae bacterium]|nr:helicase-exonuclease AddAB subunit AddA [Defluviitaleaceae bacterium]